MPFYEYQCRACGAQTEAMQKINDAPLRKCPDCGKNQLQRLVSAPVFRLKGGGWYETDFKSDGEAKRNLAGADKDAAAAAPAEAPAKEASAPKAEDKAAPKAEAAPKAAPVKRKSAVARPQAKRPAARKKARK